VQDQVAHAIGGDGSSQQAAWAKDLVLALKLLQGAGPHAVGQGGEPLTQLLTAVAE
jgi:hypothetical protein